MTKLALTIRLLMLVLSTLILVSTFPDCIDVGRSYGLWFVWLCSLVPHRLTMKSRIACLSVWALSFACAVLCAYETIVQGEYIAALIASLIIGLPALSLALSALAISSQSRLSISHDAA